jgi:MFS transporter, DHA2 family, methylenomycin A resistance protein
MTAAGKLSPLQNKGPATKNRRAQLGLYAVCFGFALVLLDTTALNVSMIAIEKSLGGALSSLQWVVNCYTIVFASFLMAFGALGDRFGVKRLYQSGLLLFTFSSMACALSPSLGFLIGARIVQGLGAATMLPASLSLLTRAFPDPDERAHAVSFWASVVSLAFAAGPALGGVLTTFLGWRSIFWINAPIGLGAMLMVAATLDESVSERARAIDWVGQFLACAILFALSYGLIEAGGVGWFAPRVLGALGGAIVLLVLFIIAERASHAPVLPGALFSIPLFATCIGVGVVLNFGTYGILFVESAYLQSVRHLNPLWAGLTLLPATVLPTVTTRIIVRYSGRRHILPRLATGGAIASAGYAALALTAGSGNFAGILAGLSLMGVAMGCIMPAMTAGVLTSSPPESSGLASGILNSSRQIGGSIGVALMGSLVRSNLGSGYMWSFGVAACAFLAMAAVAFVQSRVEREG